MRSVPSLLAASLIKTLSLTRVCSPEELPLIAALCRARQWCISPCDDTGRMVGSLLLSSVFMTGNGMYFVGVAGGWVDSYVVLCGWVGGWVCVGGHFTLRAMWFVRGCCSVLVVLTSYTLV